VLVAWWAAAALCILSLATLKWIVSVYSPHECSGPRFPITVFGNHCECIAQKCTHLERLPSRTSHLLLPSHSVLTRPRGKKRYSSRRVYATSGIRNRFGWGRNPSVGHLRYANSRTKWFILYEKSKMPIYLNFQSQFRELNGKIQRRKWRIVYLHVI